MDPRDDGPDGHELGTNPITGRTYVVAEVEPLDVDGVRTVGVGSALWLVGFVALLPFYGRLSADGHTWYLWTCMAGGGLGLLGLEFCRRRRVVRAGLDDEPYADPAAPT